MDGFDLDDLVDRLRSVAGHAVPPRTTVTQTVAPVRKKIDEASALIAQQALRRHPAIAWLPFTPAEADEGLLSQLAETAQASESATEENPVMQLLAGLNEAAEELELERLASVFVDAGVAMAVGRTRMLARLGVEELPYMQQNLESYPSPWNVLFTLRSGLLFSSEPSGTAVPAAGLTRCALHVPNATAVVAGYARAVSASPYNTEAWRQLLDAVGSFPIASVRHLWQAALYTFPTSGSLAVAYLRREIAEVRDQPLLAECAEEDDAKALLKVSLRILNTFYRHLPIAFSSELYEMFFDFITERVQPDATSLDALYRTCLQRDVGNAPSSTDLWTAFLNWRARSINDAMRRREWVKKMYLRILGIPLLQLDQVKESFESFIAVDLKGRLAFEEKVEMEKRLTRAKAEALEIERLMALPTYAAPSRYASSYGGGGGGYAGTPAASPLQLFLPRPLTTFEADRGCQTTDASQELELWAAWVALLERVERPFALAAGAELLHYSRCRNFYRMRAALFPHQVDSWTDYVHYCLLRQPALTDAERVATVREALALTLSFTDTTAVRAFVKLFTAHVFATHLHQPDMAWVHMREALVACRATALATVRADDGAAAVPDPRVVLQPLEDAAMLAVNWMRLGNERYHNAMVARFTMHNVELLSLTMACLKRLLKSGALRDPAPALRPFNTFCAEWIKLELIRNRNAAGGLEILAAWLEHLLMMVKSSTGRHWSMSSCGVDELFLNSCALLTVADPVACPADHLAAMLATVAEAARAAGVVDHDDFQLCVRQRLNQWVTSEREGTALAAAPVLLTSGQVADGGAAAARYNTDVFGDATRAAAEEVLLRNAVASEAWAELLGGADADGEVDESAAAGEGKGGLSSSTTDVTPNEALWPVATGGGGGSGGRGGGGGWVGGRGAGGGRGGMGVGRGGGRGGGGFHHRPPSSFGHPQHHGHQGHHGPYGPPRGRGGFYPPFQARRGGPMPHAFPRGRQPFSERHPGFGRGRYGGGGGGRPPFPGSGVSLLPKSAAGTGLKRARSLLAETRPLFLEETLENYLLRMQPQRGAAGGDGGAPVKETRRIPALAATAEFIRQLPLVNQYDPAREGLPSLSTDWLVDLLRNQEALGSPSNVTAQPEAKAAVGSLNTAE